MSEAIISVSGLRGIVGDSLTPLVAMKYAQSFARSLGPGPIVVARDGRTTGSLFAKAIESALLGMGRNVLQVGIAATPTVGVLVQSLTAAGGIQISASHNPLPYNGLKLFSPQGRVLPAAEGLPVLAAYREGTWSWAAHDGIGELTEVENTTDEHLRRVLATVDVAAIAKQRFRVLLDSNAGAGSILGKRLLEALGCEVVQLGGEPTGRFEHPAEPTAANLAGVQKKVLAARAVVGFCQDPDADRLALIDAEGTYVGEEYTLAICLAHVLGQTKGPVVTNCATSQMSRDITASKGASYSLSAVGEANVVDEMLRVKAVFGGEGNGGPIDPRVIYVRDSFVGMAQVLAAMAARKLGVKELAAELPKYVIDKQTTQFASAKLPAAFDLLSQHFAGAQLSRQDGLRIDLPEKKAWVIVRGSNTEPIVRIIAEAPDAELARGLCEQVALKLQSL